MCEWNSGTFPALFLLDTNTRTQQLQVTSVTRTSPIERVVALTCLIRWNHWLHVPPRTTMNYTKISGNSHCHVLNISSAFLNLTNNWEQKLSLSLHTLERHWLRANIRASRRWRWGVLASVLRQSSVDDHHWWLLKDVQGFAWALQSRHGRKMRQQTRE